ncbi:MAG TPA: hypothetical protein VJZ91_12385, partial [Blastocatellia bacterium]|nr:hypothetical protein [Blastocatellia bacterium]
MYTVSVRQEERRTAGDYYAQRLFSALDSLHIRLGGVILLVILPLLFPLAFRDLKAFGLILEIESVGLSWGVLRFIRPAPRRVPLNQ